MAYDVDLAEQIRAELANERGLAEQRMFGGLGFMIGGNMAVAASSQGGMLVRVDPSEGERLIAAGRAKPMEMRGRTMSGWLFVAGDDLDDESLIAEWVARGADYARSLPPKR